MADDDGALLDRWCAGDATAGNALFSRHFEAVFRFFDHKVTSDSDAEELVQETFLACVGARDSFRRHSSFRTFLFAIAKNVLFGYFRKRSGRSPHDDISEQSIAALSTSLGARVDRQRDQLRLRAALEELPVEQQLLLELHYWEDLDAEQLAEVFGTAPATSRSRLHRARAALREQLAARAEPDASMTDSGMGPHGDRLLAELAIRNDLETRTTTEP
ncbi:MAG TPA: RNA polymerase sigma factor [Kofleriaceae bacterium]|nr:RNA polymerase sigma factor [Kofleriaceae bacterium]